MELTKKQTTYLQYGLAGAAGLTIVYLLLRNNSDSGSATDPTGNGDITNPNNPVSFNANKIANDLYSEMKSTGFASWVSGNGDERDNIFEILKRVSATQFKQVVTAFGRKPYNPTFGGTLFAFWSAIENHSLPFIMKKELTAEDYNFLKKKFPLSL